MAPIYYTYIIYIYIYIHYSSSILLGRFGLFLFIFTFIFILLLNKTTTTSKQKKEKDIVKYILLHTGITSWGHLYLYFDTTHNDSLSVFPAALFRILSCPCRYHYYHCFAFVENNLNWAESNRSKKNERESDVQKIQKWRFFLSSSIFVKDHGKRRVGWISLSHWFQYYSIYIYIWLYCYVFIVRKRRQTRDKHTIAFHTHNTTQHTRLLWKDVLYSSSPSLLHITPRPLHTQHKKNTLTLTHEQHHSARERETKKTKKERKKERHIAQTHWPVLNTYKQQARIYTGGLCQLDPWDHWTGGQSHQIRGRT